MAKAFLDFTLVGHCIVQRRATIPCSDSKGFKRRADEGLAYDIVRRLTYKAMLSPSTATISSKTTKLLPQELNIYDV